MADHGGSQVDASEKELFPYPGKRTKSVVWTYFRFEKVDGKLNLTRAVCELCRKVYANKGNTTNLMAHLKHEHKGLLAEPAKDKAGKVQPKIDTTFKAPIKTLSAEKKANLDDMLMKLIVGKSLPLSLLDHALFKDFVKELEPRYTVPSKKSVAEKLRKKTSEMEDKIKLNLDGQGVSLTHDGWTSNCTQSYDTVTCHMIDNDWELKSAVLQTRQIEGKHTGENIASNLQKTIDEWQLKTLVAVTTDNAANEQKAVSLLGLTRFGCFGHRINLVVKKSLQTEKVQELLKKGRALVTFFHKSSSASDLLLEKQRLLAPEKAHKLIIDCPTRWNSSLPMIQRLLEQMPILASLVNDDRLGKSAVSTIKANMFSYEEQDILQQVSEVLRPFERATTILCAEKSPTMQYVCAVTKKLLTSIEDMGTDREVVKGVKAKMRTEMANRTGAEDLPLLAAVLNPDTKHLAFMSEENRKRGHRLIREKAGAINIVVKREDEAIEVPEVDVNNELILPPLPTLPTVPVLDSEENQEIIEDQPSKRPRMADAIDWLDDVCIVGESTLPTVNILEAEIERYMSCERKDSDSSLTLLQWWRENAFQFPRLAKLARMVLAVPASSVPSERVFSLAGNIVSKKRARLSPELVNMFIFLNMNMARYWQS